MKKTRVKNVCPPGMDEEQIRNVISFYDNQSEDQEAAEIERLLDESRFRMMRIPVELVPEVEEILASRLPRSRPGTKARERARRTTPAAGRAA
jgi:hypothetical protein